MRPRLSKLRKISLLQSTKLIKDWQLELIATRLPALKRRVNSRQEFIYTNGVGYGLTCARVQRCDRSYPMSRAENIVPDQGGRSRHCGINSISNYPVGRAGSQSRVGWLNEFRTVREPLIVRMLL